MKTRNWSAALILALVVSTAGTAFAATVPKVVYSDLQSPSANKPAAQIQQTLQQAGVKDVSPTDYFGASVAAVLESGLMKPEADGSFNPDKKVGTAEGLAIFAKVLGIASKTDTDDQAMTKMKTAGLVGNDVSADRDMSRLQFAKLIAAALGIEPAPVTADNYPFADAAGLSAADMGLLKALYDAGIFKGSLDNGVLTFMPDGVLTRAQIALLVDRILGAQ